MEAFHKDPMSLPMIMYHKNWPKNIEAMGEYFWWFRGGYNGYPTSYVFRMDVCARMECWPFDTVRYLLRSQEWKFILRWSRFFGVEARTCAEGITVIPRIVDQVRHFDVCYVVNNKQTGVMTLQVKKHTNSVSDINMDSERVEGLCFPLLFPHGEPGYTNVNKSHLSPDEYVISSM